MDDPDFKDPDEELDPDLHVADDDDLDLDLDGKKKKDLIDDDTVSLEDEVDKELDDEEEGYEDEDEA